MRQILVDRARKRNTQRRGGGRAHLPLKTGVFKRGLSVNGEAADVVEMRFFGGLSMTQIAHVLGVSERTADSDWAKAKQRLQEWLSE